MEKSCDLGNKVWDSGQAAYPITRNKGKEPVIPSDVDTLANDELSLGSSPHLGLSPAKNTRARLRKGPCIALPSAKPLVTRPAEQREKQAGDSTSQTEPSTTRWYGLQAQCHQCRLYISPSARGQHFTCR